jgi:transposase
MPAPAKSKAGYLSRTEVAKRFGITVTTVNNWVNRGMPVHHKDEGKTGTAWYREEDVDTWFNENEKQKEGIEEAELRRKVADATLAEIKVAKERGELVAMDSVLSIISNELGNVRAKLINLSGLIAPHIYTASLADRISIVDNAVEQILNEITVDKLTTKQLKKKIQA